MSPGGTVTRSGASLSTWWRQTDASPMRRTTIAVSPVSSASIRRAASAWRMSRSLLTFAPVPMSSFGSDAEEPAVPIDEAEVAQRPQIAVDRRERHVEGGAELVGADLTAVRDGQQEPEAAGERRVLGSFLGWPVARGGHADPRGDSHSTGINPGPGW